MKSLEINAVDRWQLPDGIEEVLPLQAAVVEDLRRQLLDLYRSWGYQLVIPPLMEFTESLLVGLGADLDLLTFKMTDQLTGRTLGVRADITPQVARIDGSARGVAAMLRRLCITHATQNTHGIALAHTIGGRALRRQQPGSRCRGGAVNARDLRQRGS